MITGARRHYIDNLRWLILLIIIPYHTAMAWNAWDEPNYIFFESNRLISSFIVFFSPYFMPLLFVLAGIGTRFALQKRTGREYIIERTKRLLVPFLFGTIVLMPIMCYIADKFNYSYNGSFIRHYAVFFTKFTDLTGADGGFSPGQFWFLLYLFVISVVSPGIIKLSKKSEKTIPFWLVLVLGLPLPLLSDLLSIGGKSLAEYTYLFLIGYFVFANDEIINKTAKHSLWLFAVGLAATVLDVYLFLWSDTKHPVLNDIADYVSEWVMVIALIGLAKRYLNSGGKVSEYMSRRSFLFYIWHFIWVVLFEFILHSVFGNHTVILFAGTILLSYIMTFICCEICVRVPFLCFLTGTKYSPKKQDLNL